MHAYRGDTGHAARQESLARHHLIPENAPVTSTPLFCGTDLAARIEAAEAQFIVAATEAACERTDTLTMPVSGGYACFAGEDSPMNKVVGLGFQGVPGADAWNDVERAYAERGAPVTVELSSLADPGIATTLSQRGYQLVGFENMLGRRLDVHTPQTRGAIAVRPCRTDEIDAWVDAVVNGLAHPDGVGVTAHEDFPRDVVDHAMRDTQTAGATAYLALCGATIAGGGSMRLTAGIAQLNGAATVPSYRRRGVQAALLATRLADAAAAGCDVAVVTTAPGSTSQKNVQRSGFHLLYARAVLTKG